MWPDLPKARLTCARQPQSHKIIVLRVENFAIYETKDTRKEETKNLRVWLKEKRITVCNNQCRKKWWQYHKRNKANLEKCCGSAEMLTTSAKATKAGWTKQTAHLRGVMLALWHPSCSTLCLDLPSQASQQQVSDYGSQLADFILIKWRDQLQHLLVWRDFCLGDHLHHIRHAARIQECSMYSNHKYDCGDDCNMFLHQVGLFKVFITQQGTKRHLKLQMCINPQLEIVLIKFSFYCYLWKINKK